MPVEPPSEEGLLNEKRAATPTTTTTTMFVFLEHFSGNGTMAHSFYAIEIPNPLPRPKFPILRKPLSHILEFPADRFPRGMRCAKLGSKFYFLGSPHQARVFPSDVYLFDPAPIVFSDSPPPPSDQLLQAVPRMTTGKPTPCVFVADGRLYVLGSTIVDPESWSQNSSIKFFEVFDPSTSKWTLLDDPQDMLDCPTTWLGSIVVGRKVFITGLRRLHSSNCPYLRFTFDLDSCSWTKHSGEVKFRFPFGAELVENDTLYGGRPEILAKLGPFTQEEAQDEKKLFSHPEVLMDMPKMKHYILFGCPPDDESGSLCHIGNRQFCYVDSGSYVDSGRSERLNILRINIFEDTSKSEATFKAKYLYGAKYELKTSFSIEGQICDCYAFTPEDKKKLMKKKMKKEKKMVDRDRRKGALEEQEDKTIM